MMPNGRGRSNWTAGRRQSTAAAAVAAWAAGAALILAAGAAPAGAGVNVWTQIGPNGGLVDALAADPADPQVAYAGSRGGVFKTTDGGASWHAASRGLKISPVVALAIDPRQPGTVYAASGDASTLEVGLSSSRDGGATWASAWSSSNGYARDGGEEYFTSMAVDPARPGTAFAASNLAIYVTHDSGQSWTFSFNFYHINFFDGLAAQVVADPPRGSVFAYLSGKTFDGGDPYVKLFESSDGGATWVDRSAGLPAPHPARLAIEPTGPGILYLLQDGKVFRSLDGADSWREARAGARTIAAGPHGQVIAGDAAGGFIRSTNGGRSWEPMTAPPVDSFTGFAFGAAPGQVFASGDLPGVVASDDGGQSWRAANRGLTATQAFAVAVDPTSSARIFAAAFGSNGPPQTSGIWRSRNGGANWRPIAAELGTGNSYQANLFIDPADSSSMLLTNYRLAARSADAGASWTQLSLPLCLAPQTIVPEPSSPSILFGIGGACTQQACGLSRSDDGGATWSCLGQDLRPFSIVAAPSDPAVLYAVSSDTPKQHMLWRSADAGVTWSPIDTGLPLFAVSYIYIPTLAVDPTDAQRLFAGFPGSVWRSVDGGAHWIERDRGLGLAKAANFPYAPPLLLAVDPTNPSLVYAGANFLGVYRSLNGGNRWQPILAGLPPLEQFEASAYLSLTPDPSQSGTVYLATWGNGLLVYSAQ